MTSASVDYHGVPGGSWVVSRTRAVMSLDNVSDHHPFGALLYYQDEFLLALGIPLSLEDLPRPGFV